MGVNSRRVVVSLEVSSLLSKGGFLGSQVQVRLGSLLQQRVHLGNRLQRQVRLDNQRQLRVPSGNLRRSGKRQLLQQMSLVKPVPHRRHLDSKGRLATIFSERTSRSTRPPATLNRVRSSWPAPQWMRTRTNPWRSYDGKTTGARLADSSSQLQGLLGSRNLPGGCLVKPSRLRQGVCLVHLSNQPEVCLVQLPSHQLARVCLELLNRRRQPVVFSAVLNLRLEEACLGAPPLLLPPVGDCLEAPHRLLQVDCLEILNQLRLLEVCLAVLSPLRHQVVCLEVLNRLPQLVACLDLLQLPPRGVDCLDPRHLRNQQVEGVFSVLRRPMREADSLERQRQLRLAVGCSEAQPQRPLRGACLDLSQRLLQQAGFLGLSQLQAVEVCLGLSQRLIQEGCLDRNLRAVACLGLSLLQVLVGSSGLSQLQERAVCLERRLRHPPDRGPL